MEDKREAPFQTSGEEAEKPHNKVTEFQQQKQELSTVFRVGDKIMEKVTKFDVDGHSFTAFEGRRRETIADKFGKDYLKQIPSYDAAVIVPSHTDYQPVIGRCWNLYHSLDFCPTPGKHPYWNKLIDHIFGENKEFGWDYLTIAYRFPTQMLPVLCLVSQENQTGKSTFGIALSYLFGRNVGFFTQDDLSSAFNPWIKNLFAIFEEISDAKKTLNKIKAMSTAQRATLNEKYLPQASFQPFVKIVILSNNDRDLIKANEHDIRYWIIRLHPFAKENYIPDFNQKLRAEVPTVLHTLQTREITAERKSRMWFDPDLIRTEVLAEVITNSQSEAAKEIRLWADDVLAKRPKGFGVNLTEIYEALSRRYSRVELKSALKEELKVPIKRTSYTNHEGEPSNGTAYFFGENGLQSAEIERREDLPF